jgi:cardiolipin synthase
VFGKADLRHASDAKRGGRTGAGREGVSVTVGVEPRPQTRRALTVPNIITLSRLAAVAAMVVAAIAGRRSVVIGLLVYALLTDVVDGYLARASGQATVLGAQLDSIADCALYLTVPLIAVLLFPVIRARLLVPVILVTLGYLVPISYGALKYRRLTSYHTFGARLAAVLLSLGFLIVLATGIRWPFLIATVVLLVSAIDEMIITSLLSVWRANVPSAWHAVQMVANEPGTHSTNTLHLNSP